MPGKLILYSILAIAITATVICYNPFLLYFLNDDFVHIPLSSDFTLLQHNSFRPLCDLSIILDYTIWHKQAWGYHFTNLLLHIINSLLVYQLTLFAYTKYNIDKHAKKFALITSVLFFIYANHSEAVYWIIGRSAMLGMIFFLPAIIFYMKEEYRRSFAWMILFSWLAWCSYESTWIILLIAALLSFADCKKGLSTFKKESIRIVILAINFLAYLLVRFYCIHEIVGNYESGAFLQKDYTRLAENFVKLLIRSWLPYSDSSSTLVIIFLLLIVLITAVILLQKIKKLQAAYLFLAAAWIVSLIPYLSLGIDTRGTESERFLYLPSLFVSAFISFIVLNIKKETYRLICFATLVFIQLALLNRNAQQYRYAGSVTKTFTDLLQRFPAQIKLYVDSVPQSCNGALLFRQGFAESIHWLGKADSLDYYSQKQTDLLLQKKYRSQEVKHILDIPGIKPLQQVPAHSAYMRFTDSVLWVYSNN